MFGFKPMITAFPVMISSDGTEPTRFDSMSKASTSTGIPYSTLLYAKRILNPEFTLMGKNMSLNLSLVKRSYSDPRAPVGL